MRSFPAISLAIGAALATAVQAQALPTFAAWDVREVEHPVLGAIKVAVPQAGITTEVKGARIVSAAFVSCEKATGTIALELANSVESDTKGGLPPSEMPRLVCNGRVSGSPARTAIPARWTTNGLGDVMARGLAPADLRRCGAIDIEQHVTLPPGVSLISQKLSMRLLPATTDLAEVLACGTPARIAEAPPTAVKASADAAPPPAPAREASATPKAIATSTPVATSKPAAQEGAWQRAHTVAGSRTNVRGEPRIDGPLVKQVDAGTHVLARKASGEWWRVKPRKGSAFTGYVREDRLAFD